MSEHNDTYSRIRNNPRFQALVAKRNGYAFVMTIMMMLVYYGYILLIAFDRELLASKIGEGMTTSLGIPMGVGVILITIVLTNIYVRRANREFDALNKEIIAEVK